MKNLYFFIVSLLFKKTDNASFVQLPHTSRVGLWLHSLLLILVFSGSLSATCTTCTGNLVVNPGFNSNVNSWASYNGNFFKSTAYPQCGTAAHAEIIHTTGWAGFYQDITTIPVGHQITLTFWAGVHQNSANSLFGLEFYNGSAYLSESTVQIDKILGGSPSMQFYTVTAIVPSSTTKVRIIGKINDDYLKVDELCLTTSLPCSNFKSLAQSELNLVKTRQVSNEITCGSQPDRVLWLDCILDNSTGGTSGNLKFWKIISGGTFKEYCDGTAYVEMTVQNVVNSNYKFDVAISYSGRTFTAPSGSPHVEGCTTSSSSNWYYYTEMKGSLIGQGGLSGGNISFDRKMASFQIGTNASLYGTSGSFGASGWFMYTVLANPSGFNFKEDCGADLNFFLSGGNLTSAQASVCGKVCAGAAVTLDGKAVGGKPSYTYNWSNGLGSGQTKTVNPTTNTTYTVTITDNVGCTATDAVAITINNSPTVNAGADATICTGSSIILTASGSGGQGPYTYIWNNGLGAGASKTVNPTSNTTFIVTVTDANGCTATDDVAVNIGGSPNLTATGTTICAGASGTISASASGGASPYTYYWSNGLGTGATKTVNPTINTTYTVTVEDDNGCTKTATATVTIGGGPSVNVGPDINLCTLDEEIINSTVNNVATCGQTGTSDCNHVIQGTTGWIESASNAGVCGENAGAKLWTQSGQGTSSLTVDFGTTVPVGTVICVRMKLEHCQNTNSSLADAKIQRSTSATSGYTDVIASKTFTSSTYVEYCYTLSTSTRYVKVSDNGKCAFRVDYVKYTTPDTYNNSITYAWTGPGIVGSTTGASIIVNQSGTYTLVVTDCTGCSASDQVVVTGNGNVDANAGPDQILCSGQSVTLSATEVTGASYEWRTELNGNVIATTRTVSVTPSITTSYILKVTKNGCEATDAVLVTVNPAPTVNVGPDINLCTMDEEIINSVVTNVPSCGESGTSDCNHVIQGTTGWIESASNAGVCGDNAGAKLWTKSGQGTSSLIVDFGTTVPVGTVICVRMKLEHCQNTNSNQSDAKIQRSTSATTGYTDVIASKTFSTNTYVEYCYTLTNTTRYVKVSDNGKCAFRVDYVKYTTPDTYNNSVTYAWSGPGIVGSTTSASIIVNQSGTYTLVVTDCGGCTASDQVIVTGNGNVEVNAGPDQTICTGNSITLTANEVTGATYEWRSETSETVISNTRTVSVSPTATTSYIVKVMKNGCENSDAVTVNVNNKPTADITGGNQVCTGSTITLTASGAGTGGSYLWSTNATFSSITVSPSVNTTYVVTVTNANGCSNTASKAVTVNPLPTVVANNDGPITCIKSNITLTATSATAVTYVWSGPSGYSGTGANASPLATVQGQYTVTVTDANGCTATASTTITQNITPPTANAGADVTVNCSNPSATLTASGGTSYLWSTGATTASITVSPNVTTTYSVTVTGSNGCTAADAVIVTANKTAPTAAVTANGNNCITENAQLFGSASGGTAPYTYAYTGPNGFTSAVQNPTIMQNGTYRLVVTDANGCSDDVDIVIFTQFDPYVITVATDICVGESVTLTASGGVSFQWDANGNNATTNSITVSPLVTTTYAVTITNQNGCVATADATITVFSKPVITNVVATPNASCNNINNSGSITVSATGQPGLTLQYRINGGTWQTSNVFNNLPNSTYNVEVSYTNRFCVSNPAQATIQSGSGPVAVAENDKSVCANAPFNLSASASGATPPYTFAWSNNMTGSNITVSGINANTTYTVTVTDALGCTGTDNVNITIIPGPVSGITGPPTICANEAALFVATPAGVGSTYLWTFDSGVPATASGSSATSQWLTPGEYGITLTVTKNGCISEYTSSIAITQSVFAAAGPDAQLCQGGNITLNGSGPVGANFTWTVVSGDPTSIDNGGSASGVLVSPLITTTYRLTVTQNGCTRIDEVKVVVDVNYNPIANAGEDRPLCDEASYIIGGNPTCIAPPQTPNAPLGYIWSPSTGLNNATIANPTLTVSNPGNYNYQVIVFSTLTGCSDTATVNFIVNPRPTVTASASPSTICIDESSILTAVGGGGTQPYAYAWSNGLGTGSSKTVSPIATTTYTVTISDNNGCTASTSVTVTVNPRPTVTASASPSTICIDESSILTAVGAGGTQPYTYAWSNGLGTGASKTVSPLATTTYTVTISDNNGCTASTSVTVTVNPRPTVTASASPSTICIDESSVLTAVGAGGTQPYTYAWSNELGAGASKTVSPTATTTYTVTITDNKGCTASTSVTLTVELKAKVGDFVWEDKNANGIQDLNEIGIGNVPVSIYDANSNVLVDQTNTLGNGYYEFNVCKGTYYIVFGEYSNYFRTFADKGSDLSDSDANQATGRTENFTLNPGDNNATIDAGYYRLASIGDFVWEDIDANGVQGMLENGVPNVQVSITGILNTTNSMGLPILVPPSILLTGPNGEYLFTNLIPGRYTVVVNKPDGYLFSPKDQGGDDAKDSDSDPVTGVMPEETLESGENNLTYDAGIYPEISLEINKTFVSALVQPNGTYNVTYNVEVINTGGPGQYDLKDTPAFDDDISINSSSYSSTASGNAGGALAGSGPWTLANDQQIAAFSSNNYSLVVNVTLDLTNGTGDNVYTKCGSSNQLPLPGEGLYNKASVDTNNDGIPEDEDDACGDLPNITLIKDFVSATINSNGSFKVTYKITVSNNGGASGVYTLTDTPSFDDDVTINDWSYFFKDVNGGLEFGSAFPGAPVVPASLGTYTITANNSHEFTLVFNVNMDLKAGSTDGGDNVFTACSVAGNGPGSSPNQGLYNLAQLDRTGDGIADLNDDACGDLPNITLVKDFVSATINNDGTFRVIYKVTVANNGGASGNYTLTDSPLFDDDVTINAWDYTFVDVNAGFGNGPSFIGSPVIPINFGTKTLTAGNSHIYTLGFDVTLDLATVSTDGGNNIYTPCAVPGNESGSTPNQGLYNLANVDLTGNGVPNLSDDACGDLPNVTMVKNFVSTTPNANGSYNVTYQIVVNNNGGAVGTYSLKDTPLFDNDVVINSGSYSGQASGTMNTSGPTTLASSASINAGSTHTYNVNFNVTLNLASGSPDGGDNIYTSCEVSGNGPGSAAGQGLYNKAELDKTGDGFTDITDDACGDLPFVTMVKDFVSITPNNNGTYMVNYQIRVSNIGGATGQYWLKDTPLFDDDVVINSGSYNGQANGQMNIFGPTILGTGVNINAGAIHTYNITFNVSLNLEPGSPGNGDKIYTPCSVAGNGPGSGPGQGYYNLAELDRNGDGITDLADDACGDDPITMVKNFLSVTSLPDGSHYVKYEIVVKNLSGATQIYTLTDYPLFDDDVTINAWDYTFIDVNLGIGTGPSFIGSPTVPINLGTNNISGGDTHIYTLGFNVTLDLEQGSTDGGNNVYTPCTLAGNGPGSEQNQGLYNRAELEITGDGITDITDDACGDIPYVTMVKNFVSATPNANGTYNVTYQISVNNNGGATGQYSLKDTPLFDNDVTINSGNYSGQASGPMNTSGSTTLANGTSINAGLAHVYNVSFNVSLNLAVGSPDGGDNIYTPCAVFGNGPGSGPGQGLYNRAELDRTGDGITDITDDACGDLPNVTMVKNFVSATPNANGTYNVTYQISVNNNGGATGQYSLKDTPLFDNDITINSGNYSGQASGPMNISGSTTLANGTSINAGLTHVYNVSFNVSLNLAVGSPDGGNNVYTPCAVFGNGPGSGPGQGLYNKAELDRTGDGITDITDDACGDLPNVTLQKQFLNAVQIANGTYNVTYKITVNNTGGTSGSYSLKDTPLFDKDIAINSGSYSGQSSGTLNTVGSTTLASNQTIASAASHVYNIIYNVTLDMANDDLDGGDNVYNPCDLSSSDPANRANKGLYNRAELDRTGDGIVDISDDACGDLPGSIGDFVWEDTNANGVQDFGEMGLPNVIVRLLNQDGVQIAFKVTGPNGAYIFNNLPPATYRVRFEKPMSFIATDMNKGANPALDSNADLVTGFTELIPLAAGENNLTIDAGYYKLAKIGDFVWEDRNSNGLQDPLEPGIPNVTVELTGTDARGTVINTSTTTNGVGFYEFANLVPGTYVVRFVKPGDLYKASPANVGMDDAKDSDASIVNGQTGTILLKSGENNNTIDAGFFRCAYVGDYVWLDDNGTNQYIQDGSDLGLNGILVELYSTANPSTPVQSMLTIDNPKFPGQKGYYNFEVCQVGTYFIKVIRPEIYEYVQPNMGLDDSKDSDIIDFLNMSTLTFTVTYAAIINDIDAGLKSKPLPVELLDFTGRYNSNKDVNELTWATASEVNNDYFEIERSFEGRAFESVGVVEGKGNSASRVSYDFTDKDISLNGVYTYRLRQVDFDGRFEYSNLVNIEVARKGVVKTAIYPNPSVSDVNLDIYAVEGAEVKVDIYDNLGKLVIQGFINEVMTGNVKTSKIESGRLNEGVYYIVVNVDGELSTHKLIIIE